MCGVPNPTNQRPFLELYAIHEKAELVYFGFVEAKVREIRSYIGDLLFVFGEDTEIHKNVDESRDLVAIKLCCFDGGRQDVAIVKRQGQLKVSLHPSVEGTHGFLRYAEGLV